MECYQLLTRGQVLDGFDAPRVREALGSQLGLNEPALSTLLSGRLVRLRADLDWAQAQALLVRLRGLGLQVQLSMQLSPECLQAGLQAIAPTVPAGPAGLSFGRQPLRPAVLALPGRRTLSDEKRRPVMSLESYSPRWNAYWLLLLGLGAGLVVQTYFLRVASAYLGGSVWASLPSLALLLGVILALPRLLQPRQLFGLRLPGEPAPLCVAEELPVHYLGTKRFRLMDSEGRALGEIYRRGSLLQARDAEGELCLASNERAQADEGSDALLRDLRGHALANTSLGMVLDIVGVLRGLWPAWRRRKAGKRQVLPTDGGQPIYDGEGRRVASLHAEPEPVLVFEQNVEPHERCRLMALAWIAWGSAWA